MPTLLTWTDKQREIYKLLEEGKEFRAITDLGYTRNMVSRVKAAREAGQKPEPLEEDPASSRTNQNLIAVTGPKGSPISFKVGTKEIVLDPLELIKQHRYYLDLAKKDGNLGYSFSEVLSLGIQIVWILTQDIPLTENMIVGILYS
jgi:hypothetical protein